MRLSYCELCGKSVGRYETHHIKSKGSGGTDIKANLINLCIPCHRKAQEYHIKPEELVIRVAVREKSSVSDIYTAIGWPIPINVSELEEKREIVKKRTETPVETYIAILITLEEEEREISFLRGYVLNELVEKGATKSWIASQIGRSTSYIRKHIDTYKAFPDYQEIENDLSFTHYHIASKTDNPDHWIEEALDKNLSTREMSNAINGKPASSPLGQTRQLYRDIEKTIKNGGESAKWLIQKIQVLLQDLSKEKKPEKRIKKSKTA